MTPEQKARVSIDALLQQAGWHVCDVAPANIHAACGVAIREFPLNAGYLRYIDSKAAGVIKAKNVGATLTGVEVQSARYAQGQPASLPAWVRSLPFSYESAASRHTSPRGWTPCRVPGLFAIHRPEKLEAFLKDFPGMGWEGVLQKQFVANGRDGE